MIRNMRRLGLILLTLPFLLANQSCDSFFANLGLDSYLDDDRCYLKPRHAAFSLLRKPAMDREH